MDENKQIFSLRKLSVGLASVVIGTAFFASQGQSVKADSTPKSSVVTKSSVESSTTAEARVNANQPGSAETESNQNFDETKAKLNRQQSLKPENIAERSIETSSSPRGTNPSNATTLDVANKNSKFFFTSKKLATNLMEKANSADASNGGFDASWGKLDVNDWKGSVKDNYYQLTDYTGNPDHVIVPNEVDFENAGISTSGKQVGVTSALMHNIFKEDKATTNDATVAFSKTNNKKVKAISSKWYDTWGHLWPMDDSTAKLSKFDGTNLDVSNVTDMDYMFNGNQISDLSSLANWKVDNVTNMGSMFDHNQISDLSPLANWNVSKVTNMGGMFRYNQISDLSPLANWKVKVDNVTLMNGMFNHNQISDLSPLASWNVSKVTNMSFMFETNQISDLSPLANWKVDNVTNIKAMFDYNYSTQTKTIQAQRIIKFVYPAGYTGPKHDPFIQTVNVPRKVRIELITVQSKPSNNILDWATKTETPEASDPVYFKAYTVPKVDGLVPNVKTVPKAQADPNADPNKPIIVIVTYTLAKDVDPKDNQGKENQPASTTPVNDPVVPEEEPIVINDEKSDVSHPRDIVSKKQHETQHAKNSSTKHSKSHRKFLNISYETYRNNQKVPEKAKNGAPEAIKNQTLAAKGENVSSTPSEVQQIFANVAKFRAENAKKQAKSVKSLPQTGESNEKLAVLGLLVSAISLVSLGLAEIERKKHQN